jgi:hypothetical protein
MIKWVIGLMLIGVYQYWIYSSFWIGTSDVSKLERATYISGEIINVSCFDDKRYTKRKFGDGVYFMQKIYIQLFDKPRFSFENTRGHGTGNRGGFDMCSDILAKIDEFISRPSGDYEHGASKQQSLGYFEGYFLNNFPLQVTINGHELYSFKETKIEHSLDILFASFFPIISILLGLIGRWYKSGGIQRLGENH